MEDFEHDFQSECGCDLYLAAHEEQCAVADEHRGAWIDALEAEWPEGSALPWELASTPSNDQFDVGEAA